MSNLKVAYRCGDAIDRDAVRSSTNGISGHANGIGCVDRAVELTDVVGVGMGTERAGGACPSHGLDGGTCTLPDGHAGSLHVCSKCGGSYVF